MYTPTDKRGQQKLEIALNLIPNTPALPVGAFSLIVADPPWSYHLRESDKTHRGRCPYPSMSDEEIMAMPVSSIAAPDSYLLLWTTNNHLPLAFRVMASWGFDYKAIHTWLKVTRKTGARLGMGLGTMAGTATEQILSRSQGHRPHLYQALGLTNVPNRIPGSPVGNHSQKPEEFYEMADRLGNALGGQRIELFSRCPRSGWESWGAEAEKTADLQPGDS